MDDQKILPSKETIRRFHERSTALYEQSLHNRYISRQHNRSPHGRDISEYQVNEPAPTEEEVQSIFTQLLALAARSPDKLAAMRRYVGQWTRWLKCGLSTIIEFEQCVHSHLPSIFSCRMQGAEVCASGYCL